MDDTKYIIVYGNPCDGFNFRGPFDTPSQAVDYAEDTRGGCDELYWVTELNAPETIPETTE